MSALRKFGPRAALVGAALTFGGLGSAESIDKSRAAAAKRMSNDLHTIASDAYEGRGLGTAGIGKAAEYISDRFKESGLKPGMPDGGWYQPFNFRTSNRFVVEKSRCRFKGPGGRETALDLKNHVRAFSSQPGELAIKGNLAFVGYGIHAPDLGYDDYAGIDVKGKVVIIMRREPQQKDEKSKFNGTEISTHGELRVKYRVAKEMGAAGIILVNDPTGVIDAKADSFAVGGFITGDKPIPVIQVKSWVVDAMLDGSKAGSLPLAERAIDATFKPVSCDLADWSLDGSFLFEGIKPYNVIGQIEGEGPLANETVVLGAHYDHLGFGGMGSLKPGSSEIHNGADDNGSGTTLLMEMARRYGLREKKPARRMVFIAFSAEESGLIGSARYVDNPVIPLDRTVSMVNFDMVGRLADDKLTLNGMKTAKEFDALVEKINKKYEFKLAVDFSVDGASDHASFYRKNIPVFFFFTGLHSDYHRPSDDPDKINYDGMAKIADFSEELVDELLTAPKPTFTKVERPAGGAARRIRDAAQKKAAEKAPEPKKAEPEKKSAGDMKKADPHAAAPDPHAGVDNKDAAKMVGRGAVLGTMPDYAADVKEGVKLAGTRPGSPADKAGLKAGDLLMKIGDDAVVDAENMMKLLGKYRPGDKSTVTVVRDGKELKIEVTFGSRAAQ